MPRPAFIFTLALTTMASGCATTSGDQGRRCHTDFLGNCQQSDPIAAAIGLGALVLVAGVYVVATQTARSAAPRAVAVDPSLVGRVRWQGASVAVPPLPVTLRAADAPVVQRTTTDREGRFQFPFPRKPGWYTVAVDAELAEGRITLWLQDGRPDTLDLLVRPRSR